ncbi:MAG: methionyl-tRNA formyltransferase [Acidobacteria bacterium]|nr:methionyl-tRNA formyltransferase [Acidobacteriota bacterium]
MRVVFCGTPEFAVPTLAALVREKFDVAAVITQPDRPKGRGLRLAAPPVKLAARKLGLRVEQPEKGMKGEAGPRLLEELGPEAVVIVGYGQIIPAELLERPRHGWINLHASLLPKYRGAAPVNWALVRGETRTGVTTMRLDAGLDTGPIFLQREEAIRDDDTAVTLGARLAELGAELMVETLRGLAAGTLQPRPQDDAQATKAPLLKKEHGRIDWSWPARDISNRVRGLVPWPGAYTSFRGELCHVWWAVPAEPPDGHAATPGTLVVESGKLYVACGAAGSEWLSVEEVQLAGRKRWTAREFINGLHVKTGDRFEPATAE